MMLYFSMATHVNIRDSDAAPVTPEPTSGLGTAGLGAWCVAGELLTEAEVSEPAEVPPARGFDTPADNSPRSKMGHYMKLVSFLRNNALLLMSNCSLI